MQNKSKLLKILAVFSVFLICPLYSEEKQEQIVSPEDDFASLVEEAKEEKKSDASFKKRPLARVRERLLEKKNEESTASEKKIKNYPIHKVLSEKDFALSEEKAVIIHSPPKPPEKKRTGAYVKIERRKEGADRVIVENSGDAAAEDLSPTEHNQKR
jgi:hypothetical protein